MHSYHVLRHIEGFKSGLLRNAFGITVSLAALTSYAYADDGYQPYYFNRDSVQFSQVTLTNPPDVADHGVTDTPPFYGHPDPTRSSTQYSDATPANPAVAPPPPPPPLAKAPDAPQTVDLTTRGGFELGLQGSNYHYQEHVTADHQFVRQDGVKIGVTGSGTATFKYNWFLTGDMRFAYSKNSYFSDPTGKINQFADDFIGDGRIYFGKDFLLNKDAYADPHWDISPYVGIGFRDLYNDSSGVIASTPQGPAAGYRRNSEYFYIPAGITQRFHVADNARLSVNAEYDELLLGRQTTYLSDVNAGNPDIENDQNHGFGVRGNVMYEWNALSIGPFVEYWNINASTANIIGYEPHNETLEYGAQIRYRFR